MRERLISKDLLISIGVIIIVFVVLGCIKFKTDSDILCNNSIETSIKYFIQSDRQDAFDELHNGFVKDISIDKAEIIFDININKIEYIDQLNDETLVRIFYEKGVMPLKVYKIVVIEKFGEAESVSEFFKLDHYTEGRLVGTDKTKIRVFFEVIDTLTYMPTAISPRESVDVFYSHGIGKPPMIRRIIKHQDIKENSSVNIQRKSYRDSIKENFERNWFKLGLELWRKVAHSRKRYVWEDEEARKLFHTVATEVAKDFNISKKEVLKNINKKEYIKY